MSHWRCLRVPYTCFFIFHYIFSAPFCEQGYYYALKCMTLPVDLPVNADTGGAEHCGNLLKKKNAVYVRRQRRHIKSFLGDKMSTLPSAKRTSIGKTRADAQWMPTDRYRWVGVAPEWLYRVANYDNDIMARHRPSLEVCEGSLVHSDPHISYALRSFVIMRN